MLEDFYYSILKPVLPYVTWIIVARVAIWLFGEEMRDTASFVMKEVRAILRLDPTLSAVNAYGLLILGLIVLFVGLAGLSVMPKADASLTSYDIALIDSGARAFYAIIFTLGMLACVYLTRWER